MAYDPATKTAIVAAVAVARAAGKQFSQVFEEAKNAGYAGNISALKAMIYKDKAFKHLPKRKRGRPKGSKNKTAPRKLETVTNIGGLSGIEVIIEQAVAERLNKGIDAAIRALQAAL